MPQKKELHFFSSWYSEGIDWYSAFFASAPNNKIAGEITPNYLYIEDVPQRIYETIPQVKLFAILRNPISRAMSAYQLFYDQRYKGVSFTQACTRDSDLVKLGLYGYYLKSFYDYFSKNQIKIWIYEEIIANPTLFFSELYTFIGVDNHFVPKSIGTRYNRIIFPKTQDVIRGLGLSRLLESIKNSKFGDYIKRKHSQNNNSIKLSKQEKTIILNYFIDDIFNLEDLIEKKLDSWKR